MARRTTRRRRNPTPLQWTLIGVGTVALGTGTYFVVQAVKDRRRAKMLAKLPKPPQESVGDPTPRCGAEYPGFVFDGSGCVPGPKTPAGIYVAEMCSDFVFVQGDSGPQLDYLESLVDAAAESSADPVSKSADPTHLATRFLDQFWGDCSWPPSPEASDRIIQLYEGIVYTIGREIIGAHGRVLGTTDPDLVDEQIAERLAELGFPEFQPDLVPEIELPAISHAAQASIATI